MFDQKRQVHRIASKSEFPLPDTNQEVHLQGQLAEGEASDDEGESCAWLMVKETVSSPSTPVEPLVHEQHPIPTQSACVVPHSSGSAQTK